MNNYITKLRGTKIRDEELTQRVAKLEQGGSGKGSGLPVYEYEGTTELEPVGGIIPIKVKNITEIPPESIFQVNIKYEIPGYGSFTISSIITKADVMEGADYISSNPYVQVACLRSPADKKYQLEIKAYLSTSSNNIPKKPSWAKAMVKYGDVYVIPWQDEYVEACLSFNPSNGKFRKGSMVSDYWIKYDYTTSPVGSALVVMNVCDEAYTTPRIDTFAPLLISGGNINSSVTTYWTIQCGNKLYKFNTESQNSTDWVAADEVITLGS